MEFITEIEREIKKENFFENTFAIFEKTKAPKKTPDHISFGKTDFIQMEDIPKEIKYLNYGDVFEFEGEYVMFCAFGDFELLNCICDPDPWEYCGCDYNYYTGLKIRRKNGTKYWYTKEGVYRQSDHWGKIKTCEWKLYDNNNNNKEDGTGFAKWESFCQNGDTDCFKNILEKYKTTTNIKFKQKAKQKAANEALNKIIIKK